MTKTKVLGLEGSAKQQERRIVNRAVTNYYDGFTAQGQTEEAEWGDFALTQLMNENDYRRFYCIPKTGCKRTRQGMKSFLL